MPPEVDPQMRVLAAAYEHLVRTSRYDGTFEQYLATIRDLHYSYSPSADPINDEHLIASQQANAELVMKTIRPNGENA